MASVREALITASQGQQKSACGKLVGTTLQTKAAFLSVGTFLHVLAVMSKNMRARDYVEAWADHLKI